ncbi:MAG: hypothetical protein R3C14_26070 [Caldilineaceae bacterium]
MKPEIIPQSPQPHCYICHSRIIDKVCHHCGRAICKDHKSEFVIRNPEFSRFSLNATPFRIKDVVHCHDCAKEIYHKRLFWRRLSRLFPFRWKQQYSEEYQPTLPTVPNISKILIKEEMEAHVSLNESGKYVESIKSLQPIGDIELILQFNDTDRERIKSYYRKYKPKSNDLLFHAGFVIANETSNLHFTQSATANRLQIDPLDKHAKYTFEMFGKLNEQGFLSGNSTEKLANQLHYILPYKISRSDKKEIPFPIQLVPVLVKDDAVALEIQSRPGIGSLIQVESARIDQLTVSAPAYASKINFVHPPARISNSTLTATWVMLSANDRVRQSTSEFTTEDPSQDWHCYRSHYMRFQNNIRLYDRKTLMDMKLVGQLIMTLKGTLSGLQTVMLFYSWGKKLSDEEIQSKVRLETKLKLDFEIDLSGLRCPKPYPEYSDTDHSKIYSNVVLDHRVISRVIRNLNSINAYVKRVVENPAHTDKTNAHITNYFWDITGRHYKGIYPVDFHLVLTGKFNQDQDGRNSATADLYVQAFVTDKKMQKIVDDSKEELQEVIDETFLSQGDQ